MPFFNASPTVTVVPIRRERNCVVIDDVLTDPQAMVDWATGQIFRAPRNNPYPGLVLDPPAAVTQRMSDYGLQPSYMAGSNAYFERVAQVSAAWNRMIFYDGGQFHSGEINEPAGMSADPRVGRLTLNGFFVCSRNAA
jgi:Family of unknown function (DUF6445)